MARVKRQARNQQLFREVNENIAELSAELDVESQALFCECSQSGCGEMIEVPAEVYRRVRSDRSYYVIRSGHHDPTQEVIVEDLRGYLIVESCPAVVSAAPSSPIGVPQR